MSFLRKDGRVWTTDKDGLIPDLLAAEITAKTGKNRPSFTRSRSSASASLVQARRHPDHAGAEGQVAALSGDDVTASTLAGEDITAKLTEAPATTPRSAV